MSRWNGKLSSEFLADIDAILTDMEARISKLEQVLQEERDALAALNRKPVKYWNAP